MPTTLQKKWERCSKWTTIANQIKTGTFSTSRIPSLSAGKITSGTFNIDRIPDLTTSKITDLETNYAKLTSGTIDVNAVPTITTSKISDIGNYVLDSSLTTTLADYVSSSTLTSTLTGYASLDANNKISTSVIPNFESTAGMTIDASLITNASWISKASDINNNATFWDSDINVTTGTHLVFKNPQNEFHLVDISHNGYQVYRSNNQEIITSSLAIDGYTIQKKTPSQIPQYYCHLSPDQLVIVTGEDIGENKTIGVDYNAMTLSTSRLLIQSIGEDSVRYGKIEPSVDINNYFTKKRTQIIAPTVTTNPTNVIQTGDPL